MCTGQREIARGDETRRERRKAATVGARRSPAGAIRDPVSLTLARACLVLLRRSGYPGRQRAAVSGRTALWISFAVVLPAGFNEPRRSRIRAALVFFGERRVAQVSPREPLFDRRILRLIHPPSGVGSFGEPRRQNRESACAVTGDNQRRENAARLAVCAGKALDRRLPDAQTFKPCVEEIVNEPLSSSRYERRPSRLGRRNVTSTRKVASRRAISAKATAGKRMSLPTTCSSRDGFDPSPRSKSSVVLVEEISRALRSEEFGVAILSLASGGSDAITAWAMVPLKPNELTRPEASSRGVMSAAKERREAATAEQRCVFKRHS